MRFLGSHICIILHGNASPNPLTRSGVLKHVVGSLEELRVVFFFDEAKQTSTRNWGPGSWPWSLCLAHKDSQKRNCVEDPLFEKKRSGTCWVWCWVWCGTCFLRQTLPSTLSMPCLMRRGFFKDIWKTLEVEQAPQIWHVLAPTPCLWRIFW